ncbi:PDZ domain-containing protein [Owenweeksia hongkongensis]|uniref:PDZ domain-containing protein n=1 Tax=Owenweeksia hongkongensis TaxID=253245 RepID=UPI003A942B2A
MKKNVFTLLIVSFLAGSSFPLLAQEEDVQKVKVNVEITKDGKTETIVKEYDVSDDNAMVWESDDDSEGERVIVIRKTLDSDEDLSWFSPPEDSEISSTSFLGVVGYTINENGGGDKRVRITKVIDGEAAAKAGLKNEDIIESIDGKSLETYEELIDIIRAKKPGDVIKMKVLREGKSQEIRATLGERKIHERWFSKRLSDEDNLELRFEKVISMSNSDDVAVKKAIGVSSSDANSFSEVSIELFPNPSNDNFKYKLKIDEGGKLDRMLLDPQGKVIENKTYKSKDGIYEGEVSLGDKPAGNYILIFKRGDKLITEKLVKQ